MLKAQLKARLIAKPIAWLILTMNLLIACSVQASSKFEPASFVGGPSEFAKLIHFPDFLDDFPQQLYCIAYINEKGVVTRSECLGRDGINATLGLGVERILDGYRFRPAFLDGYAVDVKMTFSVYYISDEKGDDVLVVPNMGLNRNEYGFQYTAPQAYSLRIRYAAGCTRIYDTYIGLTIDETGAVTEVDIKPTRTNRICRERITESLMKARYIPAMFEGKPVPARHYEMYLQKQ